MRTTTVSLEDLRSVIARALRLHGASEPVAEHVAEALGRAEQRGNTHCGLRHLEHDCAQLMSGRVLGTVTPAIHGPRPGLIHVDAKNGFAQPAFALGLPDALSAARTLGVAVLAISKAYTCAALGYFPERIAQHGFIGVAFTTASARVAAPGGSKRVLGTNPMAMSVPDGKGAIAFQFDQCTSAANLRHVREAAARGAPIPGGWAVSPNGHPTTDALEALAGALLPAGGSRGFGIGLMAEVLGSFFTHSAMSLDTENLQSPSGPPHGIGIFCLLLDPEAIAGAHFWSKLDRLKDAILSEPGTRLPGTGREAQPSITVEVDAWERAQSLAQSQIGGRVIAL